MGDSNTNLSKEELAKLFEDEQNILNAQSAKDIDAVNKFFGDDDEDEDSPWEQLVFFSLLLFPLTGQDGPSLPLPFSERWGLDLPLTLVMCGPASFFPPLSGIPLFQHALPLLDLVPSWPHFWQTWAIPPAFPWQSTDW